MFKRGTFPARIIKLRCFQPLEGLNGVQTPVGEVTNLPHTEPVLLLNYTVLSVWVQSFGQFLSSSSHLGFACERERFLRVF